MRYRAQDTASARLREYARPCLPSGGEFYEAAARRAAGRL